VSIGDWLLLPLTDAVNVAVPAAMAVMGNDTLEEPAGTIAVAGTVATAALLLDSAMLAPPEAAAVVRLTVPCPTPPTVTLDAVRVTPASADVAAVGPVADPPHCEAAIAETRMAAIGRNRRVRVLLFTVSFTSSPA
jgi:hypothetical protein